MVEQAAQRMVPLADKPYEDENQKGCVAPKRCGNVYPAALAVQDGAGAGC